MTSRWTVPLETFFEKTELVQCLHALQLEAMLFPTPAASRNNLHDHLQELVTGIQGYLKADTGLEADTCKPSGPNMSDIVQSTASNELVKQNIDAFFDKQRQNIDSSNQEEFLNKPEDSNSETCARIDAKQTNHGGQIQTTNIDAGSKNTTDNVSNGTSMRQSTNDGANNKEAATSSAVPLPLDGINERVGNISEHLHVKFVANPASSIYQRVAALEDRIMMLEKEFPLWSAQNFNQPGRSYTQPPPLTIYRAIPSEPTHDPPNSSSSLAPVPAALQKTTLLPISRPVSAPIYKDQNDDEDETFKLRMASATPKRRKNNDSTFAATESVLREDDTGMPTDASGRPIFRKCGRGVNSSLMRTVLAKLQTQNNSTDSANT